MSSAYNDVTGQGRKGPESSSVSGLVTSNYNNFANANPNGPAVDNGLVTDPTVSISMEDRFGRAVGANNAATSATIAEKEKALVDSTILARDNEKGKKQAASLNAQGRKSTILTDPLFGQTATGSTTGKTILGA